MISKKLPRISYILLLLFLFIFFYNCTYSDKGKAKSVNSTTEGSNPDNAITDSTKSKNYELVLTCKFIKVEYLLSGDLIIPIYCDATTEEIEWLDGGSEFSIHWGQSANVFRVNEIAKTDNGFTIYGIQNDGEDISIKIHVTIHDGANRITKWIIERAFSNEKIVNEFFMVDSNESEKIQLYKFPCGDDGM